jgi:hypothetical protein
VTGRRASMGETLRSTRRDPFVKTRLLMLLCGIVAVGTALASAPRANAGTYQVINDTSQAVTAWELNRDAGFTGCSILSHPGICNDADVAMPTPLRVFAFGKAAAGADAMWSWMAPPTVSIVSGSVSVAYRTTPNSRVFMKARLRSEAFLTQPELYTANDDNSRTWPIPAGNEGIAVYLRAIAAHDFGSKWENTIAVTSMTATLRDDTRPTGTLSGPLAAGMWLNQVQPVCLTVSAADAGSGVASTQLRDQLANAIDSHAVTIKPVRQPGIASYTHDLCLTPSTLPDGSHPMTVRIGDAAGEITDIPLTVKVDTNAPAVTLRQPEGGTTDRRPVVSFSVDGGPSGLASFQAALDGTPMTVEGPTATLQPAADLAYGAHTVSWSATDGAGNRRDGTWSFSVTDTGAPSVSELAPAAGSASEQRRPAIGFRLTDTGSGVDPATLHVQLDGTEIAPFGTYTDGVFAYAAPADLAYGRHTVRIAVSDRSGNAMAPVQWDFTVADMTAPVLSDARPDDGSAGSDRTPEISVAIADAPGTGVDPASVALTLDGTDVSAKATFTAGRLTLPVTTPLGYGRHVVQAGAADLAGNRSGVLAWSFEIRDETPPVLEGRLPAAGSTVAGATAIGFDVADAGTGIDPRSLSVVVDASEVVSWGTFTGGRFRYAPGNLGPGVHTVAVTVADMSGNVLGPVMWQFAVANPATLSVRPLAGAPALVAGQSTRIGFAVLSGGSPLASARVQLSARAAGQAAFAPVAIATSDAHGEVAWTVSPSHTTTYRVELADDASVATEHHITVSRRVTLSAGAAQVRRGGSIRLAGRVEPGAPGAQVTVQLLTSRGWVTVAKPRLNGASAFARTLVPRVAGRYMFRAVAPATTSNTGGISRTITVRVR